MSNAYYTEMNCNYGVYALSNVSPEDTEEYEKECAKNKKIIEDILKLPDIGEFSISRGKAFQIDMDDKHQEDLTEYGKKVKTEYIEYDDDETEQSPKDIITMVSVGKEEYERFLKKIGVNYETYKDGAILIDDSINYVDNKRQQGAMYKWQQGDIVQGKVDDKEYSVKIVARTEEKPMGVSTQYISNAYFVVSEEFMDKIDNKIPGTLYIQTKDAYKLDKEIEQYRQENNLTDRDILEANLEESAKAENAVVLVISIFLYGFITVITLIGITNIFNTITTNMNLRKKEFAMLKSIGMTKKEFNRMIRLESIFYGVKSLIIGIPIGILLSYGMYKVFRNSMEMVYTLPVKSIGISIIFVAIVIGIIMKYSMSKINKQNIIETIRNDNI